LRERCEQLSKKLKVLIEEILKNVKVAKDLHKIKNEWIASLVRVLGNVASKVGKNFDVKIKGERAEIEIGYNYFIDSLTVYLRPENYEPPEEFKPYFDTVKQSAELEEVLDLLVVLSDQGILKALDAEIEKQKKLNRNLKNLLERLKNILSPLIAASKI